jgi:L-ascorbate metabolism protein UlaG (beta-lactamase superfamily)
MDGITFIGTATMIVRLGSFTVLTDPNFLHRGQRAYLGRGLWSRRLTEPAMQPADLPRLNAVVLSHLHGDHFDRIARRQLDRTIPLVTTEHAASRLRRYGFTSHGLQPWTRYELTNGDESLTVESLPAVHAYGVLGKLLPPVMGSLLVHRVAGAVRRRVYLSGDTLTGEHLDEIRERHPEIDTAVVHLGVRAYCSGPSRWTPIKAWTFCNGSGPIWRFRCITTTTESSALRCRNSFPR